MASQQRQNSSRFTCDPNLGATGNRGIDDELAEVSRLFANYEQVDLTMVKVDEAGRPIPRLGPDGKPIMRTFQVRAPGGAGGVIQRSQPEFEHEVYEDRYPVRGGAGPQQQQQFRSIEQDVEDARTAVRDIVTLGCTRRDILFSEPASSLRVMGKPIFSDEEMQKIKRGGLTVFDTQLRGRLALIAREVKNTLNSQVTDFYDRIGNERARRAQLKPTVAPAQYMKPPTTTQALPSSSSGGPVPAGAPPKRRVSRTLGTVVGGQPGLQQPQQQQRGPVGASALPPLIPPPSPFAIPARLPPVPRTVPPVATPVVTPPLAHPATPTPAVQESAIAAKVVAPKRRVSRQLGTEARPPVFLVDTHVSAAGGGGGGGGAPVSERPPTPETTLAVATPPAPSQPVTTAAPSTSRGVVRKRRIIEEEEEQLQLQPSTGRREAVPVPVAAAAEISPPLPSSESKRPKVMELPPAVAPVVPFPAAAASITAAPRKQQQQPPAVSSASVSSFASPFSAPSASSSSPMSVSSGSSSPAVMEEFYNAASTGSSSSGAASSSASPAHSAASSSSAAASTHSAMMVDSDNDAASADDDEEEDARSQGGDSVVGRDSMFDVQVSEVDITAGQLDNTIADLQRKLRNIEVEAKQSPDPSVFDNAIARLRQKIQTLVAFLKDQAPESDESVFPVFYWRVVNESTQGTLNAAGPFVTEQEAKEDANMFLREYEARRDGIPRSVFVKATERDVQDVYQRACKSRDADVVTRVVQVSAADSTASADNTLPRPLYVAIILPWTRDLFAKVFKDPYAVFKNRFFPGSDDTIEVRRRFITAYAPAIVYAWSNAYTDMTMPDTLVHPVYSENILSPDKDLNKMNCFGVTVALYAFDSVERPGELATAEQFARDLQRVLSVRSREDTETKMTQVLQQASKLQSQTIPNSTVSLMPSFDDPLSVVANVQCGGSSDDAQCARFIHDLYRLIYANGLRIDATKSAVIYSNGDMETFAQLLLTSTSSAAPSSSS